MKVKSPRVVRKVKISGRWVFAPVAKKDGRLDYGFVIVKGQRIPAGESKFHLDFFENGRRRRPCVGNDPAAVKRALVTQMHVLQLRQQGHSVDDAPELQRREEGKALGTILEEFIKRPPAGIGRSTFIKYRGILRDFQSWAVSRNITHALMVDDAAITSYIRHLRDKRGLDPHTICDKVARVTVELKRHGCSFTLRPTDLPKVIHKEREIYSEATLQALFAACRPEESVLYQTFLLSGMREQEIAFLRVDDILVKRCALRVSAKPELGFTPKNYHERIVTVPRRLIDLLLEHCNANGVTSGLVFGTSKIWADLETGKPGGARDNNMLHKLKRLARRAGLNCGRCMGTYKGKQTSCELDPICGKFGLHKFRHTYATHMLRDRMDIASLQRQLGHADLASTKRYLHALEPEELQAEVEASSLAALCALPRAA